MKYCGRFSKKIDMNVFDEISILYEGQSKELLTFLQKYPDKKITLIVKNVEDFYIWKRWELLAAIQKEAPNTKLSVCFFEPCTFDALSNELEECVKNLTIPFFFGYIVTDFEQLQYLCAEGVSEVYLAEDICFDLVRAKTVCNRFNEIGRAHV